MEHVEHGTLLQLLHHPIGVERWSTEQVEQPAIKNNLQKIATTGCLTTMSN